jgi:hypothetical protein
MLVASCTLVWVALVPPWLLLVFLGPPVWEDRARRRQLLHCCGWGVGIACTAATLLVVLPT